MRKRGILWIMILMLLLFGKTDMAVLAASGSTAVSVSAKSVNIGDTVKVTVTAKGPSGEKAVSTMTVSFDSAVLKFVECSTTYGGGGNSVTATSDSFSVVLKAVAAGKSAISVSGADGVVFDTNEELESMAKSSASVKVKNEAAGEQTDNTTTTASQTSGNTAAQPVSSEQTATEEKKLSADNSLKSLVLSAGTLSPAFSGPVTKYTASVPNNVTSLAVTATPVNEKAVVESVSGNENLTEGVNTVSIVVRAENGVTATYTVNVTREAAGQTTTEAAEVSGESEKQETSESVSESQAVSENVPETGESQTGETEDAQAGISEDEAAETEIVDIEEITSNMEYLQKEYSSLSEKYEKLKSSRLIIIIAFIFVTVILVMIIINLILHNSFGGDDDDRIEPGKRKKREIKEEKSDSGRMRRTEEQPRVTPQQKPVSMEQKNHSRRKAESVEKNVKENIPDGKKISKEKDDDIEFIDFNDL